MLAAISEIHNQADYEPDDQPDPIPEAEVQHHVSIRNDAENRHERHPRCSEGPRRTGIRVTKDDYGSANDDKGEQRPDVDHIRDLIDGRYATDDAGKQSHQNRVFIGSTKPGMYFGEKTSWQ